MQVMLFEFEHFEVKKLLFISKFGKKNALNKILFVTIGWGVSYVKCSNTPRYSH